MRAALHLSTTTWALGNWAREQLRRHLATLPALSTSPAIAPGLLLCIFRDRVLARLLTQPRYSARPREMIGSRLLLFQYRNKILQSFVFFKCGDGKARPTSSRPRPRKAKTRLLWARFRQPPGPFFLAARIKKIIPKSGGHHRASMATPCVRATSFWGVRGGGRAGGNSYNSVLKD